MVLLRRTNWVSDRRSAPTSLRCTGQLDNLLLRMASLRRTNWVFDRRPAATSHRRTGRFDTPPLRMALLRTSALQLQRQLYSIARELGSRRKYAFGATFFPQTEIAKIIFLLGERQYDISSVSSNLYAQIRDITSSNPAMGPVPWTEVGWARCSGSSPGRWMVTAFSMGSMSQAT